MKGFCCLGVWLSAIAARSFLVLAMSFAACAMSAQTRDVAIAAPRAEGAVRGKNLLENSGFEEGAGVPLKGWAKYELGYAVAEGEGRDGSRCIVCENSSTRQRRGAVAHVTLDQQRAIPLYVEGWSRAENVSGGSDGNYSVYVDCIYADGTPLWGTNAPFSSGSHGWEKVSFFVTPAKPIKSLSLYLLFRNHSGKVWFDDIRMTQLSSPGGTSFDGIPTLMGEGTPASAPSEAVVASGDGLAIGFDRTASAAFIVKLNRRTVKFTGAPAGFFARDAASRSAFHSFRGVVRTDGRGRAVLSAEAPSLALNLHAIIEAGKDRVEISGTLTDLAGEDRSVSLYFALPVGSGKWIWWDDTTSPRDTTGGGDLRHVVSVGAGANGTMSRYPLSALCDEERGIGLSLAIPMDSPRLYRLGYDADRDILYIVYDFGLCHDVKAFPGKASFKLVIYTFDPKWGFRAALKKYYDIFPQLFVKKLEKEGLWMAFRKISEVERFEDFGFAFKEGANETKFDDQHGFLTFRYTEPQSYWQRMPKDADRTYEGCVSFLKSSANTRNRMALATLSSGIFDAAGRYSLTVRNTPWCDGCVFALNPSPRLKGDVTKAKVNYAIGDADRRYADTSRGNLDGEYLDSLEGWSALCNFRRGHFGSAGIPLTFDTLTKKPCILNAFSIYEFAKYISEDVHRRGKLMMANSVPIRFGFFCHLFDTCGIEINWKRGGKFRPEDEWIMNYRRAMMFQKPYLFLMNTGFAAWSYADTEKYMRRCAFYGFYPSFFSANAATQHYFSQPKLYNRDRPLFKKYVPIIRELGKAGWQPITHAKTSDADVRIERYGDGHDGRLYLTLLNTSGEAKEAVVEIDLAGLGLAGKKLSANVLSSGAQLQPAGRGQTAILTLRLGPGDTEAARLRFD